MVRVLLDKLFLTSSGGNFLHGVFVDTGDTVRLYYASEYGNRYVFSKCRLQRSERRDLQRRI